VFNYLDQSTGQYVEGGTYQISETASSQGPPSGLGLAGHYLSDDGNTLSICEVYNNVIRIFEKTSPNWATWSTTTLSNNLSNYWGTNHKLSGDGNTLVVSNTLSTNTTHITDVYSKSSSNTWSLTSQISSPSPQAGSGFYLSISHDATKLVISSVDYPYGGYTSSGIIYFYKFSGGTWTKLSFEAGGDENNARPLADIAGDGNSVIAWQDRKNNLGRARVYRWLDDDTIVLVNDTYGTGSTYGYSRYLMKPARDGKFGIYFSLDDPNGGLDGYGSMRIYEQQVQF
jgi:hypothetical protein